MEPHSDRGLILVGRILRAHGIRGEMKVLPETDDPKRLLALERVFIGQNEKTALSRGVKSVRFQHSRKGTIVLLDVEGIDSREAAEELRKALVFAQQNDLPALEEDEFYWHDLIGCSVETDAGVVIGSVKDVLEMPAQRVLVVKREGQTDAMIPAVDEFIERIDTETRRIVIRPIEGMLE